MGCDGCVYKTILAYILIHLYLGIRRKNNGHWSLLEKISCLQLYPIKKSSITGYSLSVLAFDFAVDLAFALLCEALSSVFLLAGAVFACSIIPERNLTA